MRRIVHLPIFDYLRTRKKAWIPLMIAALPAAFALLYATIFDLRVDVSVCELFSSFVDMQTSAVAILISFSIAMMTILVTADNENIQKVKRTEAVNYRAIEKDEFGREKKPTLFQILLSGVLYNVFTEIVYLLILLLDYFLQAAVPIGFLKVLTAINIFCISYILIVLMETVVQMYFTFWKNPPPCTPSKK